MNRLLFIRGVPGSGKHTVGQMVAKILGWDYLWLHDLYKLPNPDPVVIAVTVIPGLAMRLASGKDLVFTRPARQKSTVEQVVTLAGWCGYKTTVVRLTACRERLVQRVLGRESAPWRVSDSKGLDIYLANGGPEPYDGETVIDTEGLSPGTVAGMIQGLVQ